MKQGPDVGGDTVIVTKVCGKRLLVLMPKDTNSPFVIDWEEMVS